MLSYNSRQAPGSNTGEKLFRHGAYMKLLGITCTGMAAFIAFLGLRGAPPKDTTEVILFLVMTAFFGVAGIVALLESYGTVVTISEAGITSVAIVPWCKGRVLWQDIRQISWGFLSEYFVITDTRNNRFGISPHLRGIQDITQSFKIHLEPESYKKAQWQIDSIGKDDWTIKKRAERQSRPTTKTRVRSIRWLVLLFVGIAGGFVWLSIQDIIPNQLNRNPRFYVCLLVFSAWWVFYFGIIYVIRRFVPQRVGKIIGSGFAFLGLVFGLVALPLIAIDLFHLGYAGRVVYYSNLAIGAIIGLVVGRQTG